MWRSKLASSLMQFVADQTLFAKPRSRRLKRQQRSSGTEQLEVRQLLTGDVEFALQTVGAFVSESAVDSSGNSYIAGVFSGVVDFDPGPGIQNRISASGQDIFVAKYSSAGSFIWAKTLSLASVRGMDVDDTGSVYLTGDFNNTRDFDPGTGVSNMTTQGTRDVYVLKLESAGNFIWSRRFGMAEVGQSPELSVAGIAVSPAGDVRLSGGFYGTVDFDPSNSVANLTTPGSTSNDIYVLALNSAGIYQWARQIRTGTVSSIAVDAEGTTHVTGYFGGTLTTSSSGTVQFTPNNSVTSAGLTDGFVTRFSRDGTENWTMRFGGAGHDGATGIAASDTHGIVVVGTFSNEAFFGTQRLTAAGTSSFIVRMNEFGQPLWARAINTNPESAFTISGAILDVAFGPNGQIFAAGTARGTVDLDPGSGVFRITSGPATEAFVSVLDSDGVFLWGRATKTTGGAFVSGLAATATGEVILSGFFTGIGDFDGGPGLRCQEFAIA